jgi:hypothetical protein
MASRIFTKLVNKGYVKKPNKNAHTKVKNPIIRMSLKSLKYLEHKEANRFHNLVYIDNSLD